MKKKVAFCTLGCKVNQYETIAMIEQFINKGYEMLALHKDSDYVKKHADWFEHLEVLFENDSVKMVSTDGL